MPFAAEVELGVVAPSDGLEGADASSSCLIVDVEVDLLLKPLVSGARCVSFNSDQQLATAPASTEPYSLFVNFHDMMLFSSLCSRH